MASALRSDPTVRRLLRGADIVTLARHYIGALQPVGAAWRGPCPFRADAEPLFFVLPSHHTFRCLGCGAHGDTLDLVMQVERVSAEGAVEKLSTLVAAQRAPSHLSPADPSLKAKLHAALTAAAAYYEAELRRTPAAIAYLRSRGVNDDTTARWGLGYAPDRWDATRNALHEFSPETLVAAGLLVERADSGHYDRFRGRLMFPIRDAEGQFVGFGGRMLGEGEPKYLNSPETALYRKGSELYGLHEARKHRALRDQVLVVEGYLDTITLSQHGIENVVATLGTATTTEQITRLFDESTAIVYCFDGDRAGRRAAWRALEQTLPALRIDREVRFLFLPEGEDPDSFVRARGREAFLALVPHATPLSDFLAAELARRHDAQSIDGRARILDEGASLLTQVADPLARHEISRGIAGGAAVDVELVEALACGSKAIPAGQVPREALRRARSPKTAP